MGAMTPVAEPSRLDPARDEFLVERCLAGDERAWGDLVRRYQRLVYSVGLSYQLSDPDLGDLFQDVFTALIKGLPHLREPRSLCRWIASTTDRIARATSFRLRRERARRIEDPEGVERVSADHPPAGADLERLEEQTSIRLALAALPERCRRLVSALYYEHPQPTYAVLSQRLGMPVGSLGPTRARCIERLRRILEELSAGGRGISGDAVPTSVGRHDGRPGASGRSPAGNRPVAPRTERNR
jgi:RNA polymerase sigma factor (sigma-70 family)